MQHLNKISHIILMNTPPRQLREFITNAGVDIQTPNFQYNSNNLLNIVTPRITPTPLQYTNFIAEVPMKRPANVLRFVRNTKPRRVEGAKYYVQEIAGIYGRMQMGVKHTEKYGFQVEQSLRMNTLNKLPWLAIEFKVVIDNKHQVLVRAFENKMMLQGSTSGDPLEIAKYIAEKYFNTATVNIINYKKLDGRFRFNGTFDTRELSIRLASMGVRHSYEPEFFPSEIKEIRYEDVVIEAIVNTGYVRLHNAKSKRDMERMYDVAVRFLKLLDERGWLETKNSPPPEIVKKNIQTSPVKNFKTPQVAKLKNVIFVNGKSCMTYTIDELKRFSRILGIFPKKGWKKKNYCDAIYAKTGNKNNNVNLTKQQLSRKRGVNDNAIRELLRKRGSANVNEDLTRVKRRISTTKANKSGIPFLSSVKKEVKNVVLERKVLTRAQTTLNRYANVNQNTRTKILERVKNTKNISAVNQQVRRNVEISRLNVNNATKNKIYEDLKNKRNVNVNSYARKYALIQQYIPRNKYYTKIKNNTISWLRSRNTLPNNEEVKNKIVQLFGSVGSRVNKASLNRLYNTRMMNN